MIADSEVVFNERTNHIECPHCPEDKIRVPYRVLRNPEALIEMLELAQLDHEACARFKDERKARDHRTYRKEGERRRLLGEGRPLR